MAFPASQSTLTAEHASASAVDLADSARSVRSRSGGGGVQTSAACTPLSLLSSPQTAPQQEIEIVWRDPVSVEPEKPYVEYSVNGRYAKVKIPRDPSLGPVRRGDRKEITCFSAASRKALLNLLNSIDQTRAPADHWRFITLTYPREYVAARASKEHLDALLKRVQRRYEDGRTVLWKLEPQKRGAPHFHLLVNMAGAPVDLAAEVRWWAESWHEIAGGGDSRHLRWHLGLCGNDNKPCVEMLRSWNGVMDYASKYLGKVIDEHRAEYELSFARPGRFWGVVRKDRLPIEIVREELTEAEAVLLRREIRNLCEGQTVNKYFIPGSFSGGKHRPGRSVSGDFPVRVGDGWMKLKDCVEGASFLFGVQIRQKKRFHSIGRFGRRQKLRGKERPRTGCGDAGISVYLASSEMKRLIEWARNSRPRTREVVDSATGEVRVEVVSTGEVPQLRDCHLARRLRNRNVAAAAHRKLRKIRSVAESPRVFFGKSVVRSSALAGLQLALFKPVGVDSAWCYR